MNEKRPYEEPELEIVEIREDIITGSDWIPDEDPIPHP